jgi:hypothetical protein
LASYPSYRRSSRLPFKGPGIVARPLFYRVRW